MLAQRINKEIGDTSRVIVDMTFWLDTAESITSVTPISVTLGSPGWTTQQPSATPPAAPYDPTPVTVQSTTVVNDFTGVQLFLVSGTPGNVYTVQFVVWGSSGRKITMEVGVQINGTVYIPPNNPAPPGSQPGYVPLTGNVTMEGPLYLFEDPLAPTEAATKNYVDTSLLASIPSLPGTFRNRVKNGDFRVAQRGTSGMTVATLNNKYTLDQWLVGCNGDTATVSQASGTPLNPTVANGRFISILCGASMSSVLLSHRIESLDAVDMVKNTPVTISGWYMVDNASVGAPIFTIETISAVDNWASAVSHIAGTFPIPVTLESGVWEFFTYSYILSADGTNGIGLVFTMNNVAGRTVNFANIQFEVGTRASIFEQRPYILEFTMCQRYFQTFGYEYTVYGDTGSALAINLPLPATMRVVPYVPVNDVLSNINFNTVAMVPNTTQLNLSGTITAAGVGQLSGIIQMTAEL